MAHFVLSRVPWFLKSFSSFRSRQPQIAPLFPETPHALPYHHPLSVPPVRSLAAGEVADLFGLADNEPPHVVADHVTLDVRPGDVVLFIGPSGSGKSSLLREVGRRSDAIDAAALELPVMPLVDALPGSLPERLERLAACGLSEARLLLRTPGELSDGQRGHCCRGS